MRPAAGRVHLLLGHHVARAHGAVLFLAALADADATLGRVGEAPLVVGELEVRLDLRRVVGGPEPEVLARQVRVDHLVRVHLVVGVPDRLELAEGPDQLGPEHLGQERGLRLAVAVLAGDRPAVADDQVARLVQELAEVLDALVGLQLEVDPGVDAALAEVAVERAVVAELLEQLAEVAEVGPTRSGGTAESSHPSQASFSPGMRAVAPRPDSRTFHRCSSSASSSKSFIDGGLPTVFRRSISCRALSSDSSLLSPPNSTRSQPPPSGSRVMSFGWMPFFFMSWTRTSSSPSRPVGWNSQDLGDVVARAVDVGIAEHQQRLDGRAVDQVQAGLQDRDAGPLGARQRPGDVEAVLGQQVVEVVARDPARQVLGVAAADLVGVAVAERLEPGVDLALASAPADDPLQLLLGRGADGHPRAVVEQDVQLVDLVGGPPGPQAHQRVDAAGVVADHPAQRVVRVRRGVGGEGQVVPLGLGAEDVEHRPRLDPRQLRRRGRSRGPC